MPTLWIPPMDLSANMAPNPLLDTAPDGNANQTGTRKAKANGSDSIVKACVEERWAHPPSWCITLVLAHRLASWQGR